MSTIQPAIYARVSSEHQVKAHTIDSQVAALRDRVTEDGFELGQQMEFIDDGYIGSTLVRPALERLRDVLQGLILWQEMRLCAVGEIPWQAAPLYVLPMPWNGATSVWWL